jgi:hypothetical protein
VAAVLQVDRASAIFEAEGNEQGGRMKSRVTGFVCAAFSIALLAWAVFDAADGGSNGLTPVGLALALLLVAVLTLRPTAGTRT